MWNMQLHPLTHNTIDIIQVTLFYMIKNVIVYWKKNEIILYYKSWQSLLFHYLSLIFLDDS